MYLGLSPLWMAIWLVLQVLHGQLKVADAARPKRYEDVLQVAHTESHTVEVRISKSWAIDILFDVLCVGLILVLSQLLGSCISVMEVLYKRLMPHKLESSGQRHVMLDVYKGFLLASLMIYHLAWDLQWFGLHRMENLLASDWRCFMLVAPFIVCQLVFVKLALCCPRLAVIFYSSITWLAVTHLKTPSRKVGIHLFCLCSGAVSALVRQRDEDPLFWAMCYLRRLGRVALGAMLVSLVTFVIFGSSLVIRFGVLHMLCCALLIHLPLSVIASSSPGGVHFIAAFAVLAFILAFMGIEPEKGLSGAKSLDYEPLLINLGFLLAGDALQQLRPQNFYMEGSVMRYFARIGQWTLPLFLMHQWVLLPVAALLRFACTGRWPVHVSYTSPRLA